MKNKLAVDICNEMTEKVQKLGKFPPKQQIVLIGKKADILRNLTKLAEKWDLATDSLENRIVRLLWEGNKTTEQLAEAVYGNSDTLSQKRMRANMSRLVKKGKALGLNGNQATRMTGQLWEIGPAAEMEMAG